MNVPSTLFLHRSPTRPAPAAPLVLKASPEDFVVLEVGQKGDTATLSADEEDGSLPRLEEQDVLFSSVEETEREPQDEDPDEEVQRILSNAELGARISALNDFTCDAVCGGQVSSAELVPIILSRLPEAKAARASLHAWVLSSHAFLKTKYDAASASIVIEADLTFRHLAAAGLSAQDVQQLAAFLRRGPTHADAAAGLPIGLGLQREQRGGVYAALSGASAALEYRTTSGSIVATFRRKGQKRALARRALAASCVLRFVVQKRDTEHFAMLAQLRAALGAGVVLGVAGIKDKRAVTRQFCSATLQCVQDDATRKGSSGSSDSISSGSCRDALRGQLQRACDEACRRLLALSALQDDARGISVGRLHLCPAPARPLQLGSLRGNSFRVVVRGLEAGADSVLQTRAALLRAGGFPNFFGAQRMGESTEGAGAGSTDDVEAEAGPATSSATRMNAAEVERRPSGCRIGQLLLAGDYCGAAAAVLLSNRRPEAAAYVAALQRGGASWAELLSCMPSSRSVDRERLLVRALARFGCQPVHLPAPRPPEQEQGEGRPGSSGTLAVPDDEANKYRLALQQVPHSLRLLWVHAYQSWLWNEAVARRVELGGGPLEGDLLCAEAAGSEADDNEDGAVDVGVGVSVLSRQELQAAEAAGQASMRALAARVVLPLFGTRVQHADHAPGSAYRDSLTLAGLPTGGPIPPAHGHGGHHLHNSARDGPTAGPRLQPLHTPPKGAYRRMLCFASDLSIEPLDGTACRVEFTLPAGCYATALLRELCQEPDL